MICNAKPGDRVILLTDPPAGNLATVTGAVSDGVATILMVTLDSGEELECLPRHLARAPR